jgi:hypothetical protein
LKILRALLAIGSVMPCLAQYAGPAILSRGEAPTAMRGVPISFRPFVSLRGVYDTGLTGAGVVDNFGNLAEDHGMGVELSVGVSGSHAWKRTLIGLDYGGSARHYNRKTFYDGTDHSVNLGITHQLSRRMNFNLRQSAGIFSRDFGLIGLQSAIPFDPGASYIPNTDFFDNRTLYFSTQADLTYIRSARLSFNLGGDAFAAKRRSSALFGVTGTTARGDMQYRAGRYSTVGINYTFSQFHFSKGFGGTDLHNLAATFATRFTRTVELSMYAGAFRSETKYVQSVQIDPVIAAIIGVQSGLSVLHRIDTSPSFGARLSKTFKNAVAGISASRSVTPGNGLFLTSIQNSVSGQFSYNGVRHWSFGSSVNYGYSKAISNVVGNYANLSGTLSASRRVVGSLHGVVDFGIRQYDSPDFSRYSRLTYRATIGFSWSPGTLPLRIW